MLRYQLVVIVLFVVAMRSSNLTKGNPKKRKRKGKPPVRGNRLAQNEEAREGASVGPFSKVVVEAASIGAKILQPASI